MKMLNAGEGAKEDGTIVVAIGVGRRSGERGERDAERVKRQSRHAREFEADWETGYYLETRYGARALVPLDFAMFHDFNRSHLVAQSPRTKRVMVGA